MLENTDHAVTPSTMLMRFTYMQNLSYACRIRSDTIQLP